MVAMVQIVLLDLLLPQLVEVGAVLGGMALVLVVVLAEVVAIQVL